MLPQLWGPHLWKSIHYIALGYPKTPREEDKMNYYMFYSTLWKYIPCMKCAINYKRHLEELPIDPFLTSNIALFEWTVNIHNIVNKELGKPTMSKEDAWKLYTTSSQENMNSKIIIGVIAISIVCLALFLSKKYLNKT
jgi:hypothetical protein